MRGGDGVRVHKVVELRDPAIADEEDHGPFGLDDLARRPDALALMAETTTLSPLAKYS